MTNAQHSVVNWLTGKHETPAQAKQRHHSWSQVGGVQEEGRLLGWPFLPFGAQCALTPWAAEIKEVSRNSTNGTVVLCLTGLGPQGGKVLFRLKQLVREKFGWGIDDDLTPLQRQQRGKGGIGWMS